MCGQVMNFQKMNCMAKSGFNGIQSPNFTGRFTASLLIAVFAFTLFFAVIEAGHDCSGGDCPICACLIQCENLFRFFGLFLPGSGSQPPVSLFFLFPIIAVSPVIILETLVSEKIRLDN